MHRKVANTVWSISVYPDPVSPIMNIVHYYGAFVMASETILIHCFIIIVI